VRAPITERDWPDRHAEGDRHDVSEYRLAPVNFRITRHSGWAAPDDALDMLWQRLGAHREEASFAKAGAEIRVSWGSDAPSSIDRYEREEVGRIAILEMVRTVCEQAPELRSDWFAVGADL
jgi:hypothetical protein